MNLNFSTTVIPKEKTNTTPERILAQNPSAKGHSLLLFVTITVPPKALSWREIPFTGAQIKGILQEFLLHMDETEKGHYVTEPRTRLAAFLEHPFFLLGERFVLGNKSYTGFHH
ncbi:hypothetical protein TNIN_53621 [Trichonephila inaurata madagascariensis]|uniref:Uncharacterized protein n=1 Tax=Trichonephila inaurata madagascariensis TaxID=2747483 RepID=A0A8X6YXQ0_9ARAC|nr:hypothetical protein TNIN_53621 [Trichonephila inaurata madagascariensis]